MKKPKYIP